MFLQHVLRISTVTIMYLLLESFKKLKVAR